MPKGFNVNAKGFWKRDKLISLLGYSQYLRMKEKVLAVVQELPLLLKALKEASIMTKSGLLA